jgi:outer membrane protein OmpA-like peptidoglycan-associated protein
MKQCSYTIKGMKNCFSMGLVYVGFCFLILTGCAPRHSVVLVPDLDGHTGKAEVITDGGRQSLEKANDMTQVSGRSAAPSPVRTVDSTYISRTFGDAIAAEPPSPEKFILFFEFGGTNLLPESRAFIPSILAAIKERGALSISLSGHTDAVGSVQLNDELARSRVQAISDILIQNGVSPNILKVSSHGKGNPLVPTPDGVAEPKNRRVEVIVR